MADVWVIKPKDNVVSLNGETYSVDCSGLDPYIQHIQWNGARCIVQFDNTDVDPQDFRHNHNYDFLPPAYAPLLDAWEDAYDVAHAPKPPQAPSAAEVAGVAMLSQRAVMRAEADDLAAHGKTWEAVKLLLKSHGIGG